MNINESIRDWIEYKSDEYGTLEGVELYTMGEFADIEPPAIVVYESGVSVYQQGETVLYGVSTFEVTVELHTIPAEVAEGGTTTSQDQTWRRDLYDILGDRAAIAWITGKNYWRVFDIRLPAPITEAEDGRRVSKWTLTVVACPYQPL